MKINLKQRSFTLIELIITIVVLGVLLVPLGIMSLEFTHNIVYSRDSGVAEGLAKTEMAKVNTLAFSNVANSAVSNYEDYPYDMQRVVTVVPGYANNLKQVQVRIFPSGSTTQPLANLITCIGNDALVSFGAGSAPAAGQANSIVVSGGNLVNTELQNVTFRNVGSSPITITGLTISFIGGTNDQLQDVTMGEEGRWEGNVNSGSTIAFDTNYTLAAGSSYTDEVFLGFRKSTTSVTDLVFIFSDGSKSLSHSWP